MKVTIDLDPGIYRAVKVEAARADRSVRAIVDEALAAWLERSEDAEDAAAAAEALAEYERDGGVAAEESFRAHAAETRAAYGSPGEAATGAAAGHRGAGADDADASGAAGASVDEG